MSPPWRRGQDLPRDEHAGVPYVEELTELARARLHPAVHAYVTQGAGEGVATAEAAAAWRRMRFLPRVLRDVTEVDLRVDLLGRSYPVPVGIAPTTLQRAAHPDGEVEMARAAATCGAPLVVSSNAGSHFADVARAGAPWWLQVYLTADRSLSEPVVAAAAEAGASALVLTADTPVVARKRPTVPSVWDVVEPGWLRVNFADGDGEATREKAADLGPHDVAWLAQRFGLPVVVKGVLRAEDARRCVDAGAQAVWVSNHGGRQLDRAVTTCEALPAVTAATRAADPAAQVYVDGGLRTGLDVLAALACGADAVFLGRPPFLALADAGADGVVRLWDELGDQLVEAMRLVGVGTVADLDQSLVHGL